MIVKITVLALCLALMASGCGKHGNERSETPPAPPESSFVEAESSHSDEAPTEPALRESYAIHAADELIARVATPGMTQREQAKAVYDYLITNTIFDQPVGLDIWRVRGGGDPDTAIPYLENRALSPLVFGIGSCEDYAAALTLLLQRMGMEAIYLPGITISVDGGFVDHAWTVAKIEGQGYHLDCQLEDNILKDNTIVYRYFMRSDQAMLASHRWSENFIDYGGLTEAQIEEIRRDYIAPECPENAPTPPPNRIIPAEPLVREVLERELREEILRWEAKHGPLTELALNTIPPVFAGGTYP